MNLRSDAITNPWRPIGSASRVRRLWAMAQMTFALWLQRSRDRSELAGLGARQRRDMGLTIDAIEAELDKPFWRP